MHIPPSATEGPASSSATLPTPPTAEAAALATPATQAPSASEMKAHFEAFLAAMNLLRELHSDLPPSAAPQVLSLITFIAATTPPPSVASTDENAFIFPLKGIYLFLFPFMIPRLLYLWRYESDLEKKNAFEIQLLQAIEHYYITLQACCPPSTSSATSGGGAASGGEAAVRTSSFHSDLSSDLPSGSIDARASAAPTTTGTVDLADPEIPSQTGAVMFRALIQAWHFTTTPGDNTADEFTAASFSILGLWKTHKFQFAASILVTFAQSLLTKHGEDFQDEAQWGHVEIFLRTIASLIDKGLVIARADSTISLTDDIDGIPSTFHVHPLNLSAAKATPLVQCLLDIIAIYQSIDSGFPPLIKTLTPYLRERHLFEVYAEKIRQSKRRMESDAFNQFLVAPCVEAYKVIAKIQFVDHCNDFTAADKSRLIKDIYTIAMASEDKKGLCVTEQGLLTYLLNYPENSYFKDLAATATLDRDTFQNYKRGLATKSNSALLSTSCTLAYQVIAKLQVVFENYRIVDPRKTDIIVNIYNQALIGASAISDAEKTRLGQLLAYPENFDIRSAITEVKITKTVPMTMMPPLEFVKDLVWQMYLTAEPLTKLNLREIAERLLGYSGCCLTIVTSMALWPEDFAPYAGNYILYLDSVKSGKEGVQLYYVKSDGQEESVFIADISRFKSALAKIRKESEFKVMLTAEQAKTLIESNGGHARNLGKHLDFIRGSGKAVLVVRAKILRAYLNGLLNDPKILVDQMRESGVIQSTKGLKSLLEIFVRAMDQYIAAHAKILSMRNVQRRLALIVAILAATTVAAMTGYEVYRVEVAPDRDTRASQAADWSALSISAFLGVISALVFAIRNWSYMVSQESIASMLKRNSPNYHWMRNTTLVLWILSIAEAGVCSGFDAELKTARSKSEAYRDAIIAIVALFMVMFTGGAAVSFSSVFLSFGRKVGWWGGSGKEIFEFESGSERRMVPASDAGVRGGSGARAPLLLNGRCDDAKYCPPASRGGGAAGSSGAGTGGAGALRRGGSAASSVLSEGWLAGVLEESGAAAGGGAAAPVPGAGTGLI